MIRRQEENAEEGCATRQRGGRGNYGVSRSATVIGGKMGITVVRETEDGNSLGSVEDPSNLLHRLLPTLKDTSFQVLRFIDWYGDTVINRPQLELFLEEWDRITQGAKTEEERMLLSRIGDLAAQAQRELHTYLKFYGD
jgi:hypothetical protein